MRTIYLPLCIAAFILAGCNNASKSIEEREERDPLIKTAHAFMEQGKWDDAIDTLKEALENEPRMARPHLDLATIYQQHSLNYIHAIYHYDRYLELRPDSEKAEFIEQQKIRVGQALANTLINNSKEVKQVVGELKRLQQENAALKQKSATPTQRPATADSTPARTPRAQIQTVTQAVPKSADAKTTPASTHKIYHVVAGDNLSKISARFYGEAGRWDDIFQANKDRMKSPGDLRVGQTLIIPNAGN